MGPWGLCKQVKNVGQSGMFFLRTSNILLSFVLICYARLFIYNCFDKTNKLRISFNINWLTNEFIFSENLGKDSDDITKFFSKNLFDIADEKGRLQIQRDYIIH